jgi:hypothetical protein
MNKRQRILQYAAHTRTLKIKWLLSQGKSRDECDCAEDDVDDPWNLRGQNRNAILVIGRAIECRAITRLPKRSSVGDDLIARDTPPK